MGYRNQILGTCILSIVCINIGILHTWPSSAIILFESENTTLSRTMTQTELSLFGSLPSIGALVTTPLSGYLIDKFGRKYLAITVASMHALTWVIRVSSQNVAMMLLSCVVAGVGGCGILVCGVFISEFAQDSIRGILTSSPVVFTSTGLLISYLIGGTLDYYVVLYISLAIALLSIVLLIFLKESPTHLMLKGLEQEAAKSMAFYRNVKSDSNEVVHALDAIKKTLESDLGENCSRFDRKFNILATWQFLKKSKSTRRAFGLCLALALLFIFQGLSAVQVYAVSLFTKAVPNLSSSICSAIVAVMCLLGNLTCMNFIDVVGRKVLMTYASVASALCCVLLGLQLQVSWGPQWLTVLLIYIFVLTVSIGPGTTLFVLTAELFLPEIKGFATVMVVETKYVANFILLYLYIPLVHYVGLSPVFYIFAIVCFMTVVFAYFMLPETKGLSIDAIQLLFDKPKKTKEQEIVQPDVVI